MWTGTPYDRWQKRLGVTMFLLAVCTLLYAVTTEALSDAAFHLIATAIFIIFIAMTGLLGLKKLYFWLRY